MESKPVKDVAIDGDLETFNRTSMESKQVAISLKAFNRTSMESKRDHDIGILSPNPFNRTSMESKRRFVVEYNLHLLLLIEPVWNRNWVGRIRFYL